MTCGDKRTGSGRAGQGTESGGSNPPVPSHSKGMCVVFVYFGRSLDSIKHFPLVHEGTKFVFGIGEFSNVEQLMEHFQNYPIIGGETGFGI